MALTPYTTDTDLATYMGVAVETFPADIDTIILRATDFLYYATMGAIPLYEETADVDDFINDACCAQVEYWLLDVDAGLDRFEPTGATSVNGVTLQREPKILAPRARRILFLNGYFNRHVIAKGSWTSRSDLTNFD